MGCPVGAAVVGCHAGCGGAGSVCGGCGGLCCWRCLGLVFDCWRR